MQAGGLGGADLWMWWKLVGVKEDDEVLQGTKSHWPKIALFPLTA